MYDLTALEDAETTQHLACESPDQLDGETPEVVDLDKLVEIHAKKLSGDTEVTAEDETLGDTNHRMLVLRILRFDSVSIVCRHGAVALTQSRSLCRILTSTSAC